MDARAWVARTRRFFLDHPILLLALFTPGIPEYLSGSSSPAVLVANPLAFFLLLALNLGIYTGGVLLIREARVRWHLGLASVLALGLAYGIAEEGLALTTLFDPRNGQINPSTAGSWGGVNWAWTSGILPFHAVFSVAIPLFLLDRTLPELRDRSLVSGRALWTTGGLYLATIGGLGGGFALRSYWMGWPVLLGSLLAIAGLVAFARRLPPDALALPNTPARLSRRQLALLGFSIFPVVLIGPGLAAAVHPPTPVLFLLTPVLWGAYLLVVLLGLGRSGSGAAGIALVAGMVLPLVISGELVGAFREPIGLPVVVLVDLLALGFLWTLYRGARPEPAPQLRPPGAGLAA